MGWIIFGAIFIIISMFCYMLCAMSGWCSRDEEQKQWEEEMKSLQDKSYISSDLSELEKQAVKELLEEIENTYEINRDENATITDCLFKKMYECKSAIIKAGNVVGFALDENM